MVNEKLVNQLPLNGRNFIQLATLSPGVNGVGFSAAGTIMSGTRPDDRRPGTEIFSNGNREGSNNFLYDGIDDNERLTLSIVLRPAVEAVREFKIQTNLYSADMGRNSGAVVDVITKSGTNQLHGSLFEFLRNSAMDARNFFSPKGTAFPSFRLNQFGGSFGGPVVLPKLYNGKRQDVLLRGLRRLSPRLAAACCWAIFRRRRCATGDFSETAAIYDPLTTRANPNGTGFIRDQFPGNQIPANRWDPIAIKMINAYPTADQRRPLQQLSRQSGAEPEMEPGRCARRSPDHRRRTISSPAGRFRTPRRRCPALTRRRPFRASRSR